MPTSKIIRLTIKDHKQTISALQENNNNITKTAQVLHWTRGKLETRIRAANAAGLHATKIVPKAVDPDMADRVFELEAQLKSIRANALTDEYVKRQIIKLKDGAEKVRIPSWLLTMPRGKGLPGVPSCLWSDWHVGEVVDPNQINGVNEYNLEIFDRRLKRLVATTINLLTNHVVNPKYEGVVINLGGDMHSGDIHEELSESNEKPTMVVMLHLLSCLTWAIKTMADQFGKLFVPCVSGNHGRNTKKPRAKGRNFSNFDWLLYKLLEQKFENDPRVTFFIPDGPDASYNVMGHRYLLTHGDAFRSNGDAQIGSLGAIIRGGKRKLTRNAGIGLAFDTMLIGHFHQYQALPSVIVNGSIKGFDEYANSMGFAFEVPIQALWLTHPQHGINLHFPVRLEDNPTPHIDGAWVTWNDTKQAA